MEAGVELLGGPRTPLLWLLFLRDSQPTFSRATCAAAASMTSKASLLAPNGVVGGDGTREGPFGLPLLETALRPDQLPIPTRVD